MLSTLHTWLRNTHTLTHSHTHTHKHTHTQWRLSPEFYDQHHKASDPHQQWCADDDRGVAHEPLPSCLFGGVVIGVFVDELKFSVHHV